MSRKEFTKAVKVARYKYAGERCEECAACVKFKLYHVDHNDACGLTGEATFANARILCIPCHLEKTKKDVAVIAHAKRMEAKHLGAKQAKQQIKSRGFAKSAKERNIPLVRLEPRKLYI